MTRGFLLGLIIPGLGSTGLSFAGVVVNEIVSDVTGSDAGYEWVELYNSGSSPVDLSGWELQRAKSSWGTRYTFEDGASIPAGAYLVVGDELVTEVDIALPTGESLDLGNASSNGDGVRLVDGAGEVVDTVVYGPTDGGLEDDTGSLATTTAPTPPANQSIARTPNGSDTNACGTDWRIATTPTPGEENPEGPGDPTCDTAVDVVINEALPAVGGDDAGFEWVELRNNDSVTVDLSGWMIEGGTSSFSNAGMLPPGTTLGPGRYLVVAQQGGVIDGAVVADGFSLGNASSNADGVRVSDCLGGPIDTVIYGGENTDGWLDDMGSVASPAPKPSDDRSIARIPDGADSDDSSRDFVLLEGVTPGVANDTPPESCGAELGIVINEVLVNPPEADGGNEWLELYHAGSQSVDLEGWMVQTATSNYSTRLTIERSFVLEPGELLLIGGLGVAGADLQWEAESVIPNGTGGDGIRLVDCSGFVADSVVYGSENEDGVIDDSGSSATDLAPAAGEGSSLARIQNGYDTDDCALDFVVDPLPTPGEPNPTREPIVCVPSSGGGITINEILPDPESTDAGLEWVELHNATDEDISIAGWYINAALKPDDDGARDFVFGGGTTIGAGDYLVVGGDLVDAADIVGAFSLGNGSGGDAVRLYDCDGERIDSVIYGSDNEDQLTDDTGEIAIASVKPGSSQSLARVEDGVDSDSSDDWKLDGTPSPGQTNVQVVPDIPEEEGGCGRGGAPGGGCGGPASDSPDSRGCVVGPLPLGGLEVMLLALGIAVRRRR